MSIRLYSLQTQKEYEASINLCSPAVSQPSFPQSSSSTGLYFAGVQDLPTFVTRNIYFLFPRHHFYPREFFYKIWPKCKIIIFVTSTRSRLVKFICRIAYIFFNIAESNITSLILQFLKKTTQKIILNGK